MIDPFEACLAVTLGYEGGLSLIRSDPGNWTGGKIGVGELKGTNFGIAASAHPSLDIKGLTMDGAGIIYRQDYWVPSGAGNQAPGLDLSVFDAAVNSGVAQGKRWLARSIGTAQKPASTVDAIHAYAAARLSFLHALRSWSAFGKGWGARVAGVEAKALRMALGVTPAATVAIKAKAVQAQHKARATKTQAKASGAVLLIGPAGAHVATPGHYPMTITLGVAALVTVVIFSFSAWRQAQRGTALTSEALNPSQTEPIGAA